MKRKRVSTHRTRLPMRLFMLTMGLIIAGMHVFILRMAGTDGLPLPIMGLILLIDALLLWWAIIFAAQSKVTLYEEGIELQRGGSKLFTTWDNVSHMGVRLRGNNSQSGLYLHEKVSPETRGLADRLIFGWDTKFIPIGQHVNMPRKWGVFSRKINTDKFLESKLGQEMYALAPHLFEDEADTKRKHRLEDHVAENDDFDLFATEDSRQQDTYH